MKRNAVILLAALFFVFIVLTGCSKSNPAAVPDQDIRTLSTKVPYIVYNGTDDFELHIMNFDGTEKSLLALLPKPFSVGNITLDGIFVFSDHDASNVNNISFMNLEGSGFVKIVSEDDMFSPNITKNGDSIVYTSGTNIYKIEADGTGNTQITYITGQNLYYPKWSPDGSKILFNIDGSKIWIMNADGSDRHELCPSATTVNAYCADWSPAGNRIVFTGHDALASYGMWTIDPDGTNMTLIHEPSGMQQAQAVRWLSNNKIIYEQMPTTGYYELFSIDADGLNETNLTNTPALSEYLDMNSPD
jgi:Tol biopolymer transport system component